MIRFEQMQTGTPKDILVITDDANAELAEWTDMFEHAGWQDSQTLLNLDAAKPGADGLTKFVIPGHEAGEVGDLSPELEEFLDGLNAKVIDDVADTD